MLRRELPDKNKWPANTVGYTGPVAGSIPGDAPVIDLNCDMGEGMDNDAIIMSFVSSVNIACGYHAGDEATMRRTVELALKYKIAIGAHPSYPDRENFGRLDMLDQGSAIPATKTSEFAHRSVIGLAELAEIVSDQLDVLQKICLEYGTTLHHVKPHGELYNRAARDPVVGAIICRAIQDFDPSLILYGLSGSSMHAEADRLGLRFVQEVFADRSYREDGHLTPRSEPGALIEDPAVALRQVLKMIREGRVITTGGKEITLAAGTVCLHGDGRHAAEFARMIHEEFMRNGIVVKAP